MSFTTMEDGEPPARDGPNQPLPAWIRQSQNSARALVTKWIQTVFREVCLQILKKRWSNQVHPSTVDEDERVNLVVTQEDLKACDIACRQIGRLWSQKLRDREQHQVAQWVDRVVTSVRFWDDPEEEPTEQAEEEVEEEEVSRDSDSPNLEVPLAATLPKAELPLTRLQKLGGMDNAQDYVRAIDFLASRGQISWPYDWKLIQKTAVDNTKRLHSETLRGRPRVIRPPVQYEIVSKAPSEGQEQAEQVTTEMPTVLKRYIERKRAARQGGESMVVQKRTRTVPPESSREPSRRGKLEKWSWMEDVVASFSLDELAEMMQNMLHPDNDTNDNSKNIILGSLKDVGHVHFCMKNHEEKATGTDNDKKQKRAFRRAQKERLGPHSEEREVRAPRIRWTKVMRVVNEQTTTTQRQEHWMELDLGECLVELDMPGGERSLCAFSSLEVSLKDEDINSSS